MALKIVFWNIQNCGDTRTGKNDIIDEICDYIDREDADIVCIQELQASNYNAAATIIGRINNGITNNYDFILCPHNGFEMYLYLYKGSGTLQAVVLDANGAKYVDDDSLPDASFTLTQNSTIAGNGTTGLNRFFPLFDYPDRGNAARAPGVGLFRYIDINNTTHWLTIFNWHNDACNQNFLIGNITRLRKSVILNNGTFDTDVGGIQRTFDSIIIGGDFNYNMYNNPYANYVSRITAKTHLFPFDKDNDSKFTTALSIRDRSFDNILTRFINNNLGVANSGVVDLAEFYMTNKTGITKSRLSNSNLITQILEDVYVRKRLMSKFSVQKKKKVLTKKTMFEFSKVVEKENLYKIRTGTMIGKIRSMGVPDRQKEILTEFTTEFLTKELTTNNRWNTRLGSMNNLCYNDTLFLTRHWLSDHLPVFITLNP